MPDVEKWFGKLPGSSRALRIGKIVLAVLAVFVVVWLVYAVHRNQDALANSAAVGRVRGQALGTAQAQLEHNGLPTVKVQPAKPTPGNTDLGPTTATSTPKFEKGIKGDTGDRGDQGPGPSKAQVQQAVTAYCDQHSDCKGKPSQAQVAAAVLTYCDGSKCDGPTGPSGKPGQDATGKPGASGSPGAQGPPPTADQVADAVNAFCADGACRGAKGDTGDTGPAGPAGPAGKDATGAPGKDGKDGKDAAKIDGGTCTGTTLTFHETDGSTFTVKDACGTATVTTTVTAPPNSPEPTSTTPATP